MKKSQVFFERPGSPQRAASTGRPVPDGRTRQPAGAPEAFRQGGPWSSPRGGRFSETTAIAAACGYPLPEGDVRSYTASFTEKDSKLTPSLYRDVLAGHPTESHYVLDDLVRRARDRDIEAPLLELAALQLRIYNARAIGARMTRGG